MINAARVIVDKIHEKPPQFSTETKNSIIERDIFCQKKTV